jgi:hypothetical protein
MPTRKPGYVVVEEVGEDHWRLIGDADRAPGAPAAKARALAIQEAAGGQVEPGRDDRAILLSEWKIAGE